MNVFRVKMNVFRVKTFIPDSRMNVFRVKTFIPDSRMNVFRVKTFIPDLRMNVFNTKTFVSDSRMNVFTAETAMAKAETLSREARRGTLTEPSETAETAGDGIEHGPDGVIARTDGRQPPAVSA
jgi:hypothetical protein